MKSDNNRALENYTRTLAINTTSDRIFHALTNGISNWWTEMFEGSAVQQSDIFTVRFGDNVHKTFHVTEVITNSKIVWYVEDSRIAVPGLQNQKEWIGTTIEWTITSNKGTTQLHLTHIGLHPGIECYTICNNGWQQFTDSLRLYSETGKGNPYKQQEAK